MSSWVEVTDSGLMPNLAFFRNVKPNDYELKGGMVVYITGEKGAGKTQTGNKSGTKVSVKNLAVHQRIVQHALEMANLKSNQCRWPIGDPDSEHFHFCGETVFVGKPYCYEHCKQAYQFAPPKKK